MSKLKEVAAAVAEKIGLPDLVKRAKTAADHDRVLAELDAQIKAAQTELNDLEGKRSTFILEGGDADGYQARVALLRDRLSLLHASRSEAQRRRNEATADEARRDLEARVSVARAEHFDTYERRLNDHVLALKAVIETGEALKRADRGVEAANYDARAAGRDDLVMSTRDARSRVMAALLDRSLVPPAPTRHGPVPEDLARRIRGFKNTVQDQQARAKLMAKEGVSEQALNATETDAAFALRLQNHERLVADLIIKNDPLRQAAEEVYRTLDEVTVPRQVGDVRRNRRVDFRTFRQSDGQVIERRMPVDGLGSARPLQLR